MNNNDKISIAVNKTDFGSEIGTDALAPPQSSNEGGIIAAVESSPTVLESDAPRLVIRGESLDNKLNDGGERFEIFSFKGKPIVISIPLPKEDGEPYSAITDFLNCTFTFKDFNLDSVIFDLVNCLGEKFSPIVNRFKGLHGWQESIQLGDTKTFFAYGGQNNTAFLSIPAEGCHMVPSWSELTKLLRDKFNAKITRWDGAVDDYDGIYNVDLAVSLYQEGLFNAGGKTPSCGQNGNWIKPDGRGRTFYVGRRENGKMLRVYEKGMQLGKLFHPWVRWEIEFHNKDRIIPWEVLLEPGKYVAGSYPKATGWVQQKMQRIHTLQNTTRIHYDCLTHYLSHGFGKHINVMLEVEGSYENVVKKIIRDGIPKRLDMPIPAQNEGWTE
ncbi:MAG TPA: replication initiation factor domain-containing protein [Methylotenera sp.]|nr:replication initiation factor domain-containing protein [Methylotenera sp.]